MNSNDNQYAMQIKTRKYAIISIVFGLIMILTGYSALSYDLVQMSNVTESNKYIITVRSYHNRNERKED